MNGKLWAQKKDTGMDVKVTTRMKVTTMLGAARTAGFALDHAHWVASRGKIMSQRANKLQRPFLANSIYCSDPISKMSKLQRDMNKQLQAPKPVDNDVFVK